MMDLLEEQAQRLLDIALKYDMMNDYLSVFPGFELPVTDSYGNRVDSVSTRMNAIYKRYKEDPGSNVNIIMADTFIDSMRRMHSGAILIIYLREIEYLMNAQASKKASFKVDIMSLLLAAKDNIAQNLYFYQTDRRYKEYPDGYMQDLESICETLESKTDLKLM